MKIKKIFSLSFAVIILFAVVFIIVIACVNLDAVVITNPDFQKVEDGTYEGNSKVGPVRVTLNVEIKNRTMTSIEIVRHFNGRGKKAEAIIPLILEKQSLEVDVVSGATGSSKAILKAVEDALK